MNDMVEKVIREEVQKILSIGSEVPNDDMPEQEVPLGDLPGTVLDDNGISREGVISGGAGDKYLSQFQAGESIEPNEALEGSALDPLTNIGIGALAQGALRGGPVAYLSRAKQGADDFVAAELRKAPKQYVPLKNGKHGTTSSVMGAEKANDVASTVGSLGLKKAGQWIGKDNPLGSLFNTAGTAVNKATDPIMMLGSDSAANRLFNSKLIGGNTGFVNKLKKLDPIDDVLNTQTGRYLTGSVARDPENALEALVNVPGANVPDETINSVKGSLNDVYSSIKSYLTMSPEEMATMNAADKQLKDDIVEKIKDIAKGEGVLLRAPKDIIEFLDRDIGLGGREPVRAIMNDYSRQQNNSNTATQRLFNK